MRLLLFTVLIFTSFGLSNCRPGCGCPPPDNVPNIFYSNKYGTYLYKDSLRGYKEDSIKIYFKKGDTLVRAYSPIPFFFDMPNTKRYLQMDVVNQLKLTDGGYYIVFISLKKGEMDTLKCHSPKNYGAYDSIWYNGVLQSNNVFDVVK